MVRIVERDGEDLAWGRRRRTCRGRVPGLVGFRRRSSEGLEVPPCAQRAQRGRHRSARRSPTRHRRGRPSTNSLARPATFAIRNASSPSRARSLIIIVNLVDSRNFYKTSTLLSLLQLAPGCGDLPLRISTLELCPSLTLGLRIGNRGRGVEHRRVGMARAAGDPFGGLELDQSATREHGHPRGNVLHHCQIVGDEQIAESLNDPADL